MIATWLRWLGSGFNQALSMVWLTWWPLILGFTLSGLVQGRLGRERLARTLGVTTPRAISTASLAGVISSSCSYAASATARAIFARGSSFTNSLVFMVASTNLVVELGVVLFWLLGWRFLLAQLVGGVVMILLLSLIAPRVVGPVRERALRTRVSAHDPPEPSPAVAPAPAVASSWRTSHELARSARYTVGDLAMLRTELVGGFLVAGFVSAHVPPSWWRDVFYSGHGLVTAIENVVVAPLVAVLAFVCSVGNIPLAAALWGRGVAFGGVIAFIFADLITLPLLAIYRRYYGLATTWRLLVMLWAVFSLTGLLVEGLFRVLGALPTTHHVRVLSDSYPMGATLVLNVLATLLFIAVLLAARSSRSLTSVATDPVCHMTVATDAPAATLRRDEVTYYFCSPRCRDRFARSATGTTMISDDAGDATDPVCQMRVDSSIAISALRDEVTYYFCSDACRREFLSPSPGVTQRVDLRRTKDDE